MNYKSCLLIFVKNPQLGKVKTRLAKTLGDYKALIIYDVLLQKTNKVTQQLDVNKVVCYSSEIDENDLWNPSFYNKGVQVSGSLGERMSAAFQNSFRDKHQKVVIIGSDCYDLTEDILKTAFRKLDDYDVVIGPANDGGYYLLGMNKFIPELFEDKSWSEADLIDETKDTIGELKLNYCLLKELADIDTEQDLRECNLEHLIN